MSIEGVDYAWSRPDPAGLYAAGKRFASRYLSYDRTGKNLTADEARQLAAAGIAVVSNWEWQTGDAKGGYDAGVKYAAEAERQAAACGMPRGRPIYFSVDYDPAGAYGPVDSYFLGIASVLPIERIGAYGGYGTIEHLLGAGLIRWAWQTYAWSAGRWHPGAHVQQYRNGVVIAGGDLDLDRALVEDFGQWTPGGTAVASDDELYIQHVINYRVEAIIAMRDPIRIPAVLGKAEIVEANLLAQAINGLAAALAGGVEVPAKVGLTDEAIDAVADATADEIAADPERDGAGT